MLVDNDGADMKMIRRALNKEEQNSNKRYERWKAKLTSEELVGVNLAQKVADLQARNHEALYKNTK